MTEKITYRDLHPEERLQAGDIVKCTGDAWSKDWKEKLFTITRAEIKSSNSIFYWNDSDKNNPTYFLHSSSHLGSWKLQKQVIILEPIEPYYIEIY